MYTAIGMTKCTTVGLSFTYIHIMIGNTTMRGKNAVTFYAERLVTKVLHKQTWSGKTIRYFQGEFPQQMVQNHHHHQLSHHHQHSKTLGG